MTENWVQQADNALKRAAQRAREVAERTHTAIVVQKDGVVVKLYPSTGAGG